jgi:hypothetical protein
MKKMFDLFDGITGFGYVLILGFIVTLIFATKLVLKLWNVECNSVFFCLLVWITIVVTGTIISFTLAYIYNKLFEKVS